MKAIVTGEVSSVGSGYLLTAALVAAESGDVIPRLVEGNVFAGLSDDGDEFTFEVDVVASQFNVGVGGRNARGVLGEDHRGLRNRHPGLFCVIAVVQPDPIAVARPGRGRGKGKPAVIPRRKTGEARHRGG